MTFGTGSHTIPGICTIRMFHHTSRICKLVNVVINVDDKFLFLIIAFYIEPELFTHVREIVNLARIHDHVF
ncbi:hypothetical protein [Sporosarcina limicola]|uniref:Uncharacterized protein n=1 Tax=Sporosarcina limicola TaxID=34101 RepID=A0A927MSJ1_9BACL|nr:hypothetical protein [Sporosarcina limicola]MBE1556644.1 hypothetical protein [Sporosarcina limicola]